VSVALWASSCTLLKDNSSRNIVTIEGDPVSTEEFLYVYNKNNLNSEPVDTSDIRNYLDMFINFKLKVKEAERLGLDQDSLFVQELEGYRKQLASPYLTETKLLDSMTHLTYERLKTEVNASHILIQVSDQASADDTAAAYEKITMLGELINSGEKDFAQVAFEHSEDPSAKQNKGNLGYFTAMQMVYPFEEAAYSLPVDSLSDPIRSNFGYHLIKVHDRRPSQGKVQVSHILVRTRPGMSPSDSTLTANRAAEIYQKAISQENWELLCRQFSEDVGTKMKGGKLPWFGTGDISNIPSFEEAAFNLTVIGQISKPVQSAYGWHILRLEGKKGLEDFEVLEPRIRSSISGNSRAKLNQQELVKRLKKENHFKENRSVVEEAMGFANETLVKGTWQSAEHWDVNLKTLFTIGDSTYLTQDFYQYLEERQPLPYQGEPQDIMESAYDEFSKEALIAYEDAHLGEKYYDYRMLLKEYRDGILLFQLMETKVWNKAIQDTVGLHKYFDENRERYQWQSRVVANIYNVEHEKALESVKGFVEQGHFSFPKYDFYSEDESLNKAQVKILSDISQLLLQNKERFLITQYDPGNTKHQYIYGMILDQLSSMGVDTTGFGTQPEASGSLQFIVYVASSSVKDLAENMNKDAPLTLQWENGRFQPGEHPLVDKVPWEKGAHVFEADNRFILVEITEVLPAGDQELDEIKGQVISDYQTLLEEEWVQELRSKYQVDIHEAELDKVYEEYYN
jgi:peptidyl-prolyl cis-trans isomerase SurA